MLWGILVIVALGIETGAFRFLARGLRAEIVPRTFHGRVFDPVDGRGVPGAVVIIQSRSPAMMDWVFWDPDYVLVRGRTDGEGNFAIPCQTVGQTSISVLAPGRVTIVDASPWGEHPALLPMRRQSETSRPFDEARLHEELSTVRGAVEFDLDGMAIVSDPDSAEIAIEFDCTPPGRFELVARNGSGIRRVPSSVMRESRMDRTQQSCEAPEGGYAGRDSISSVGSWRNEFWVRLSNEGGPVYGRLFAGGYVFVPAPHEPRRGGVSLRAMINRSGTRETCSDLPPGEDSVRKRLDELDRERTDRIARWH